MPSDRSQKPLVLLVLAIMAAAAGCADGFADQQAGGGGPGTAQPDAGTETGSGTGNDAASPEASKPTGGDSGAIDAGDEGASDVAAQSCASAPVTSLHYAAGVGATNGNGGGLGFNIVDISSVDEANALPAGIKGLVWIGTCNGADSTFVSTMQPFVGNPNVYGFYLMDEPDPTGQWTTLCPVANLQAESDWVHANIPGTKTFIVLLNLGSSASPDYTGSYNPANSGIDLYGVDPYPCRTDLNGCDYTMISAAVPAVTKVGIPVSAIVPVYQSFGGGGWTDDTGGAYLVPTPAQEAQIFATWAPLVPTPEFDYVYAWYSQNGDTALSGSPQLQPVFAAHNSGMCGGD